MRSASSPGSDSASPTTAIAAPSAAATPSAASQVGETGSALFMIELKRDA
jgi:hypothetical protein